jgi:hypothetical protein
MCATRRKKARPKETIITEFSDFGQGFRATATMIIPTDERRSNSRASRRPAQLVEANARKGLRL